MKKKMMMRLWIIISFIITLLQQFTFVSTFVFHDKKEFSLSASCPYSVEKRFSNNKHEKSIAVGNTILFSVPNSKATAPDQRKQKRTKNTEKKKKKRKKKNIGSNKNDTKEHNFSQLLQSSCHDASSVLEVVGRFLSPKTDPSGKFSSLVLVRLSKILIAESNHRLQIQTESLTNLHHNNNSPPYLNPKEVEILAQVCDNLSFAIRTDHKKQKQHEIIDFGVEGIKAAGVISRLLYPYKKQNEIILGSDKVFASLIKSFHQFSNDDLLRWEPHQISGLKWAFDSLSLSLSYTDNDKKCFALPDSIHKAYQQLQLPFRIRPNFLSTNITTKEGIEHNLTVQNLVRQVDFQADEIQTKSNKIVVERRKTAWEGEDHVPGFAYSAKVMPTKPFSPLVRYVRDILHQQTSIYYDCCLLNLYPDGDSGMRYHIDPDQGQLWGYNTAVVSAGATRRFAFRKINNHNNEKPHNFIVMDGDCTEMFGNCQMEYQHTVKTAEAKKETTPRSSLVFKETWSSEKKSQ